MKFEESPLALTKMFEDIIAEFDFESRANTSSIFLPSFNLGQHNLVEYYHYYNKETSWL